MEKYRPKSDNELLNEYAESLLIQNDLKNKGRMELDKAIYTSDIMEKNLDSQILNQKKLLEALRTARTQQYSNLNDLKRTCDEISTESNSREEISYEYKRIDTPEIYLDWDKSVEEHRKFAEKMGIDLSHPLADIFSNVEYAELSSQLVERFGSLRLDKYDYAFATFAGIIGGIVDAVFVGTIGKDSSGSKLQKSADELMNKVVQVYAKLNGWNGPRVDTVDSTKSAIEFLERKSRVSFDARYGKDIQLSKVDSAGLNPSNHHLRSLAHSPTILGLIVGIFDIVNNTTTLYIPGIGVQVRTNINSSKAELPYGIFSAAQTWLTHIMSDIAGAGDSITRGAGIPAPMASILQQFEFGKIPIDGVDYNIGQFTGLLYLNGYDFRSFTAQMVPVLLNEALVRGYWFYKQHFFYGKDVKESMPFGNSRELQRLLLVAASSFSGVDFTHAAIKNPTGSIEFFMTLNYVQMADFGFHLFVNVKLEYKHGKEVRNLLQTEIREEWEKLCEAENILNDL